MSEVKALFCYGISEKANLAYDTETGEPAKAYLSFSFKDDNDNIINVPAQKYPKLHERGVKAIANQLGIEIAWIEQISIREYEKTAEE